MEEVLLQEVADLLHQAMDKSCQIRNHVRPVAREGDRGRLEEEGACLGPSLECKGKLRGPGLHLPSTKQWEVLSKPLTWRDPP